MGKNPANERCPQRDSNPRYHLERVAQADPPCSATPAKVVISTPVTGVFPSASEEYYRERYAAFRSSSGTVRGPDCPVCERWGDLEQQARNSYNLGKNGRLKEFCPEHDSMYRGRRQAREFRRKSRRRTTTDRFLAHTKKTEGCWEWTGPKTTTGYGELKIHHRAYKAHRIAYELFVGEIGDRHLHHVCKNPLCVNPEHLEPVTPAEHAHIHNDEWWENVRFEVRARMEGHRV